MAKHPPLPPSKEIELEIVVNTQVVEFEDEEIDMEAACEVPETRPRQSPKKIKENKKQNKAAPVPTRAAKKKTAKVLFVKEDTPAEVVPVVQEEKDNSPRKKKMKIVEVPEVEEVQVQLSDAQQIASAAAETASAWVPMDWTSETNVPSTPMHAVPPSTPVSVPVFTQPSPNPLRYSRSTIDVFTSPSGLSGPISLVSMSSGDVNSVGYPGTPMSYPGTPMSMDYEPAPRKRGKRQAPKIKDMVTSDGRKALGHPVDVVYKGKIYSMFNFLVARRILAKKHLIVVPKKTCYRAGYMEEGRLVDGTVEFFIRPICEIKRIEKKRVDVREIKIPLDREIAYRSLNQFLVTEGKSSSYGTGGGGGGVKFRILFANHIINSSQDFAANTKALATLLDGDDAREANFVSYSEIHKLMGPHSNYVRVWNGDDMPVEEEKLRVAMKCDEVSWPDIDAFQIGSEEVEMEPRENLPVGSYHIRDMVVSAKSPRCPSVHSVSSYSSGRRALASSTTKVPGITPVSFDDVLNTDTRMNHDNAALLAQKSIPIQANESSESTAMLTMVNTMGSFMKDMSTSFKDMSASFKDIVHEVKGVMHETRAMMQETRNMMNMQQHPPHPELVHNIAGLLKKQEEQDRLNAAMIPRVNDLSGGMWQPISVHQPIVMTTPSPVSCSTPVYPIPKQSILNPLELSPTIDLKKSMEEIYDEVMNDFPNSPVPSN